MPLDGWDHVELWVGNAKQAAYYYEHAFGFHRTAYAGPETGVRDRASYVLEQGEIRLVLSSALRRDHEIGEFVLVHGDGVKDISLRVPDATEAYRQAVQRGARGVLEPTVVEDEHGRVELASIGTYGDVVHTFVNRGGYEGTYLPGYTAQPGGPVESDIGLLALDHIVGNVELGRMDKWVEFYEQVFGMTEMLHFSDEDISTEYSALMSKVMSDGQGKIKFPINEPAEGRRKSQIEEYLEFNHGPGSQHIAMQTGGHRRDRRGSDAARRDLPQHARGVLRRDARPGRHDRRELGRPAPAPDPRRPRRRRLSPPDLHEDGAGPADPVLRGDRAPRCPWVRRRELQGALRGDRARAGPSRQPLSGNLPLNSRMTPQRRAALVSVIAAATLLVLKLSVGLATHSLGLVSEAVHSGTDLVAALLTFFAVRVAARPADVAHQFGHGKAEHLSALGEAAFLVAGERLHLVPRRRAARELGSARTSTLRGTPSRSSWSSSPSTLRGRPCRGAPHAATPAPPWRRTRCTSASDFAGTLAVLIGLIFARAGHPEADPIAALFVGVLVLLAAARLIRRNTDVLMDRAPAEAEEAARAAIVEQVPTVELRRLRMRSAAGRQFADVVIGVPRSSVVGQGHAAADAVEAAVEGALPGSDVVVHVEPIEDPSLRERAHAAALAVPACGEVHNLVLVDVAGLKELSLHVKLPGSLSLEEAHAIAEQVEDAICKAVPEIQGVQTHLEPLTEAMSASEVDPDAAAVVLRVVREATGAAPRALRFLRTVDGLVAFLTLGLDGGSTLAEAHARASVIEERIRHERPDIADVIVHTEP